MKCTPLFFTALACVAFGQPAVAISHEAASGPQAVVTDSGGVPIITSTASDVIYARVADEPALTIGLVEGPAWTKEHLEASVPNARLLALAEDFPLPATLPGYDRLTAADTGEIWAQRYMLPRGATAHWDVFHPDGTYLGRVDVPASFRLHGASDGQLLGVHEDELGVQRVQVRDLRLGG